MMQTRRRFNAAGLAALAGLTLAGCGGSGSDNSSDTGTGTGTGTDTGTGNTGIQPEVANYAGSYSGTFSGAESGTFSFVIDTEGKVLGSGRSETEGLDFNIRGTVNATGDLDTEASVGTAGAANYVGTIAADGAVSGTWSYIGRSGGGDFVGSRD